MAQRKVRVLSKAVEELAYIAYFVKSNRITFLDNRLFR
jgi:hypothetical protein